MEDLQGRTTIKRRKNLQLCKVEDISYQSLYDLYEKECKLKNLSETTIKGYWFANNYFLQFAGTDLKCCGVTQDLINNYILSLKERLLGCKEAWNSPRGGFIFLGERTAGCCI